jgi:hypothetical protein
MLDLRDSASTATRAPRSAHPRPARWTVGRAPSLPLQAPAPSREGATQPIDATLRFSMPSGTLGSVPAQALSAAHVEARRRRGASRRQGSRANSAQAEATVGTRCPACGAKVALSRATTDAEVATARPLLRHGKRTVRPSARGCRIVTGIGRDQSRPDGRRRSRRDRDPATPRRLERLCRCRHNRSGRGPAVRSATAYSCIRSPAVVRTDDRFHRAANARLAIASARP